MLAGGGGWGGVRRIDIRYGCVWFVPIPAEQANLPSPMKGRKGGGRGGGGGTLVSHVKTSRKSSLLTEDRSVSPA
jgi:hypothetical protein